MTKLDDPGDAIEEIPAETCIPYVDDSSFDNWNAIQLVRKQSMISMVVEGETYYEIDLDTLTLGQVYGGDVAGKGLGHRKDGDAAFLSVWFRVLGSTQFGGPDALAAVKSAIKSAEPPVQDEAVRILSTWPNNWPQDRAAGQALLTLTTSAEKMSHQVLGLRGYLRFIRGNKKLSNEQKVARIEDVWSHIKRPEERRQAIAVLAEAPNAGALGLLTRLAEDRAVAEEAYLAMVRIAGQDIRGVSKDQRRQVLKTVAEKSSNNDTKQRARKTLRGVR